MANFPVLKSGAVAQYPMTRALEYSTRVFRFLDGTEQRFRDHKRPVRTWVIRLELLDEAEMAAIEDFFLSEQGRLGSFSFTDPRDGAVYPDCSLESDAVELDYRETMRGTTMLTVKENMD